MTKNISAEEITLKESVILRSDHPIRLVEDMQVLFLEGCVLDKEFVPRLKTAIMEVRFHREITLAHVRDERSFVQRQMFNITASIDPATVEYPKEYLDEMSWDALKLLCSLRGITGRDRQKITNEYLKTYGK